MTFCGTQLHEFKKTIRKEIKSGPFENKEGLHGDEDGQEVKNDWQLLPPA